ncbi:FecR family protein, partial [Steroidobacter sp.]|uniref:FecR family protein n=1 Tax=Steroidobacter sp. TaxID=1978227 RepID=UPI001A62577A
MSSSGTDLGRPTSTPEAVGWLLRLQEESSRPLNPDELREWERFASVAANRSELARLQDLWMVTRALGGPLPPSAAELLADDYDESMSIEQWQARRTTPPRRRGLTIHKSAWLAAAMVAGTAVAIWRYSAPINSEALPTSAAFNTAVAEQRLVELADGSVVTLGARTEIDSRLTDTERVIVLTEGEAWFKVAHDASRPFRVLAGNGVITALGTEFNVRRDVGMDLDRVTVTVGTGVVSVEPSTRNASPNNSEVVTVTPWRISKLTKGEELSYDARGLRSDVKRADIEATAAWKQGRIEYIHQPLEVVVARVNRYSRKPIVLEGDTVRELDLSGTVFEGQTDEWLRALQAAFPISVHETEE